MIILGMRSKKMILNNFFSYFGLTSKQKYHYAQMKLVGQAYWWWKDNHVNDQCWFVLQDYLRTLYAPHILYASEADYNEPNVEQDPKLENRPIVVICTELLDEIQKLAASQTAKVDAEPESELVDEPEPKVVDELDSEQKLKILLRCI